MRINKTRLSLLMAQKNMRQQDLVKRAEISRGTLSAIINGKTCRPVTAIRIAQALDCDITEIIED